MRPGLLLLIPFLPLWGASQETVSQANAAAIPEAGVETAKPGSMALGSFPYSALRLSFGQQATTPQQARPTTQTKPSPPPKPPSTEGTPPIEGSMIGYIENAIPGSEVRIRMETGFGMDFPDRDEFFYAKCGCYGNPIIAGLPANDPKASGPGPGVITDLNYQELYLHGEYGVRKRFSVFTDVPFRWIQPQSFVAPSTFGTVVDHGGLSDIQAGFKVAAVASANRYVTFQLKAYFPTGDGDHGLGTNHYSIEPALLYYARIFPRVAIESQAGIWHPIGGSAGVVSAATSNPSSFAGNVLFYGVGPSYRVYNGERVRIAPVVEVVGWYALGGYETVWTSATRIGISVGGTDIVNIKFGVRTSIDAHNSIYVGYGRGLTSAIWYSDIARVEYRHTF
jgi:hypothetical protein